MSPIPITIPFMQNQMRLCGNYHEGRTDNAYGWIVDRSNRLIENYWRVTTMSKNLKASYPKPMQDPLTFINRKLTEDEKDVFELWFGDNQKSDLVITQTFHEGYKVTIQWQKDMEIFNALLFPPKEGNANSGMCISSKSTNWYKALAMCVYKHAVLTKGVWSIWVMGDDQEG